jgi:hypothetical protein
MNALIKNKKNPFALPLIINPCPDCGNTPKLMYSPTFKSIGLVHPDEDGHYVNVSDDVIPTKENVEVMVKNWNAEVLKAEWSDEAIEKHFLCCRNYLVVEEETKAIINNYASYEDAKMAKNVYEKHYGRACLIAMMANNFLHICLEPVLETTN